MIGLFYGTVTHKTLMVADKIKEAFGNDIKIHTVDTVWENDFINYDCLIIGVPTWFDGELSPDWDEFFPELRTLNLKKKKVALFGLGDQKRYPDNFVDGIGILADAFVACGATLVGQTSPSGYTFIASKALKNGKLQGLAIDLNTQPELTDDRINAWVAQLKKEFAG